MSIAVIGAGKWGQALHYALSQNTPCKITSRQHKELQNFVALESALGCEYLIFALPAQVVRGWLKEHFVFSGQKVLVAAKGIEKVS